MNIFYNQNGVGDVLFVQLTTERPENKEIEKKKDIALIKDEATGKVVAFNVFNASNYVKVDADGQVETTEQIVGQLQEAFKANGVELELDCGFQSEVCHRTRYRQGKTPECG